MAAPQEIDLSKIFDAAENGAATKAHYTLELVGIQVVNYLRSLTDSMRPPVKADEGPRQAHPGGWADVSGQLALSYHYDVRRLGPTTFELTISNNAEYAEALEARDGYFVISGVFDSGLIYEMLEAAFTDVFGPDAELPEGPGLPPLPPPDAT